MTKRIDPMIPVNQNIHDKLIADGWTLVGRNQAATRSSEYRRAGEDGVITNTVRDDICWVTAKGKLTGFGSEPSFVNRFSGKVVA
jgi:hypothetical protein